MFFLAMPLNEFNTGLLRAQCTANRYMLFTTEIQHMGHVLQLGTICFLNCAYTETS